MACPLAEGDKNVNLIVSLLMSCSDSNFEGTALADLL